MRKVDCRDCELHSDCCGQPCELHMNSKGSVCGILAVGQTVEIGGGITVRVEQKTAGTGRVKLRVTAPVSVSIKFPHARSTSQEGDK